MFYAQNAESLVLNRQLFRRRARAYALAAAAGIPPEDMRWAADACLLRMMRVRFFLMHGRKW